MKFRIRIVPITEKGRALYYGGFANREPSWYTTPEHARTFDSYADAMLVIEILAALSRCKTTCYEVCI
nr:MAG TPA: hypothetical protein [Caudoviricetes sp.]